MFPTRNYTVTLAIDGTVVQPDITVKKEDTKANVLYLKFINKFEPVDLTGIDVRLFIVKPDGTRNIQFAEIIDAVNGMAKVVLDTASMEATGTAVVEVSLRGSDSEKITLLQEFNIEIIGG